jgi:hypothetical protein
VECNNHFDYRPSRGSAGSLQNARSVGHFAMVANGSNRGQYVIRLPDIMIYAKTPRVARAMLVKVGHDNGRPLASDLKEPVAIAGSHGRGLCKPIQRCYPVIGRTATASIERT